jgi:hypothetical protein
MRQIAFISIAPNERTEQSGSHGRPDWQLKRPVRVPCNNPVPLFKHTLRKSQASSSALSCDSQVRNREVIRIRVKSIPLSRSAN